MDAISTAGAAIRAAERLSPDLAARASLRLFLAVGPAMPMRDSDEPIMGRARRWRAPLRGIRGRGAESEVYEWGTGADVVVLAHGWQGRASQFGPLVRELRAEGFRVVAFDAPAHGAAPGRGAYIVDWMDTIRAIQARHGALHGIVGHSFGGLASLVAVAEGVQVGRVVTASAPADADAMFGRFRAQFGFGEATDRALRARFARDVFEAPDAIDRVSALRHPLSAHTQLLVAHDPADRRVPFGEALRLRAAMPRAESADIRSGHSRILRSDAFLDAVTAFLTHPDAVGRVPASPDDAARRSGSAPARRAAPAVASSR